MFKEHHVRIRRLSQLTDQLAVQLAEEPGEGWSLTPLAQQI